MSDSTSPSLAGTTSDSNTLPNLDGSLSENLQPSSSGAAWSEQAPADENVQESSCHEATSSTVTVDQSLFPQSSSENNFLTDLGVSVSPEISSTSSYVVMSSVSMSAADSLVDASSRLLTSEGIPCSQSSSVRVPSGMAIPSENPSSSSVSESAGQMLIDSSGLDSQPNPLTDMCIPMNSSGNSSELIESTSMTLLAEDEEIKIMMPQSSSTEDSALHLPTLLSMNGAESQAVSSSTQDLRSPTSTSGAESATFPESVSDTQNVSSSDLTDSVLTRLDSTVSSTQASTPRLPTLSQLVPESCAVQLPSFDGMRLDVTSSDLPPPVQNDDCTSPSADDLVSAVDSLVGHGVVPSADMQNSEEDLQCSLLQAASESPCKEVTPADSGILMGDSPVQSSDNLISGSSELATRQLASSEVTGDTGLLPKISLDLSDEGSPPSLPSFASASLPSILAGFATASLTSLSAALPTSPAPTTSSPFLSPNLQSPIILPSLLPTTIKTDPDDNSRPSGLYTIPSLFSILKQDASAGPLPPFTVVSGLAPMAKPDLSSENATKSLLAAASKSPKKEESMPPSAATPVPCPSPSSASSRSPGTKEEGAKKACCVLCRNGTPCTIHASSSSSQHHQGPLPSGDPAKPFLCHLCGKHLASRNVYHLHMRSHSGEKPFTCNLCGHHFSQKTSLTRHMRSHTGERPFPCEVCGKRFADKERIKIHMRTHTGEKPFACEVCGKCFSQKSTVKRHMSVHTGEKPFKCETCGKGFANRGNLNAHSKTHSSNNT